jgi:hypothetical protein
MDVHMFSVQGSAFGGREAGLCLRVCRRIRCWHVNIVDLLSLNCRRAEQARSVARLDQG